MTTIPRYSMVIEWSDEDNTYIVSLLEWGNLVHTHGDTYVEAVALGEDLIEALMASRRAHDEALPATHIFAPT